MSTTMPLLNNQLPFLRTKSKNNPNFGLFGLNKQVEEGGEDILVLLRTPLRDIYISPHVSLILSTMNLFHLCSLF